MISKYKHAKLVNIDQLCEEKLAGAVLESLSEDKIDSKNIYQNIIPQ
jgi:hypothetical protein